VRSIRHYKEKRQQELKRKYKQPPPRPSARTHSKEEEMQAALDQKDVVIEELYTLLDASNDPPQN
jgi:hypothetical protein